MWPNTYDYRWTLAHHRGLMSVSTSHLVLKASNVVFLVESLTCWLKFSTGHSINSFAVTGIQYLSRKPYSRAYHGNPGIGYIIGICITHRSEPWRTEVYQDALHSAPSKFIPWLYRYSGYITTRCLFNQWLPVDMSYCVNRGL